MWSKLVTGAQQARAHISKHRNQLDVGVALLIRDIEKFEDPTPRAQTTSMFQMVSEEEVNVQRLDKKSPKYIDITRSHFQKIKTGANSWGYTYRYWWIWADRCDWNYVSNGWHWQWEEYEVDDSELEEGDVVYEYLTERLLRLRETLTKKYVVCILNWVGFTCFIQNATCIV